MNLSRTSGRGGRPYPRDKEREIRVKTEMLKNGATVSALSLILEIPKSCVSEIISGRRISPMTEQRIADHFGLSVDYLFPKRTNAEIIQMREKEESEKARLEQKKRGAA
jgi:plasmid maintenance system antidote protein VapI